MQTQHLVMVCVESMWNQFINIGNNTSYSPKFILYLFYNLRLFHIFQHCTEYILNGVQEASSSNLDTPTMRSIIG